MTARTVVVFAMVLAILVLACLPGDDRPEPATVPTPQAEWVNSLGMPFVRIPAGQFVMGTPPGEWGRCDNEGPQRTVTITRPFFMCRYETVNRWFGAFLAETGYDPRALGESDFQFGLFGKKSDRPETRDEFPVTWVSWYAALRFCNWLSRREDRPEVYEFLPSDRKDPHASSRVRLARPCAGGYRLPTEAEWEYAARAGTRTAFFFGPRPDGYEQYAYTYRNRTLEERMIPTSKRPNPWGLFHMVGNVGEWCWDRYGPDYESAETLDPTGPRRGELRVTRDGADMGHALPAHAYGRSGTRLPDPPTITRSTVGFRVVFNPTR